MPGDNLVESKPRHRILGPAPQHLLATEATPAPAGRGQGARQLIEAVEPADLLDHVGLARNVVMEVDRDGDLEDVLAGILHAELEALEVGARLGGLHVRPQQRVEPRTMQRDHVRLRKIGQLVDCSRQHLAAAELGVEP